MSSRAKKFILKGGLAIFVLPLTYLLFAIILSLVPVGHPFDPVEGNGIEIFISSNGVHTDFVVPIMSGSMDWHSYFPASNFRGIDPSTMSHIAFGWGDQAFYLETPTWADLKMSTAVKALFFKSNSAMHVTYLRKPKPSSTVKRLVITESQYAQLASYIESSFQKDSNGQFYWISGSGYRANDTFYVANGSFSLFKTCNAWTGKGLREMGVKTGVWTPFSHSVLFYL